MNRILLLFSFATLFTFTLKAQSIPNGGFEDWTDSTLYQEPFVPVDYLSTNIASYLTNGLPNLTPVEYGDTLGTVAHFETTEDSIVSLIMIGSIEGDFSDPLTLEFVGGIEINPGGADATTPIRMYADINYDMKGDDSVLVVIGAKNNGTSTGFVYTQFTGSSNGQFERMSFDIDYPIPFPGFNVADSLVIGIVSGNPDTDNTPGSFLEVDNIWFRKRDGSASFPTFGTFETWVDVTVPNLEGWITTNPITEGIGVMANTEDFTEGSQSVSIVTKEHIVDSNVDQGFALLGEFNEDYDEIWGGMKVDSLPIALIYDYMYTPGIGNDSAGVFVGGYVNNPLAGRVLVLGGEAILGQTSGGFVTDTLELFNFEQPDTVYILLESSYIDEKNPGAHTPEIGSEFIVDNLRLQYAMVTGNETVESSEEVIFPNPSVGQLNVANKSVKLIKVYDAQGQFIKSFDHAGTKIESGLTPGIYFYELIGEGMTSRTLKKLVIE